MKILGELPAESVDAVITDPPYSSGGFTRGDRAQKTSSKYVVSGTKIERPEFFGDNRDQRGYLAWSSLWMAEALRITRQGGYLLVFTDWRQLPITTDAVQAGGWVWRGIAVWDKTECVRPQMGWFRAQCEYIVLAVNGGMGKEQDRQVRKCLPGVFRYNVKSAEKMHITGKPVALMADILNVLPDGAVVLDPFAGSGTTLLAAKNRNLKSIGIEMSADYCKVIKRRLEQGVFDFTAEESTMAETPPRLCGSL
jgi:site-specific DNA-methyltransferase (adenine-specific)